jgi:hypothetical protein
MGDSCRTAGELCLFERTWLWLNACCYVWNVRGKVLTQALLKMTYVFLFLARWLLLAKWLCRKVCLLFVQNCTVESNEVPRFTSAEIPQERQFWSSSKIPHKPDYPRLLTKEYSVQCARFQHESGRQRFLVNLRTLQLVSTVMTYVLDVRPLLKISYVFTPSSFRFQQTTMNPNKRFSVQQCPFATAFLIAIHLNLFFFLESSHPCANKPAKHYIGFKANYINSVNCITVVKESSGSLKLIFLFSLPRLK